MSGISIGSGIGVVYDYNEVIGGSTPTVTNAFIQQDGTSLFLLQDGTSYLILQ